MANRQPTPAEAPIGVFDSGVGGLSVLQALQRELPHEHFVYAADSGHAPYGERDDDYVLARSRRIADHLVARHGIKALVVACNTATAAAIHTLRAAYSALPMVGLEPALKPAAESTRTGVVGVMATRGTLTSQKFAGLLQRLHGSARFVLQPCDGLADAIERDDTPRIAALCSQYIQAMGRFGQAADSMDTLVLGCTHYPLVIPTLQRLVGADTTLLEAGQPVARQTRRVLDQAGLLHSGPAPETGAGDATAAGTQTAFFSTGDTGALEAAVRRWMGLEVSVQPLAA